MTEQLPLFEAVPALPQLPPFLASSATMMISIGSIGGWIVSMKIRGIFTEMVM